MWIIIGVELIEDLHVAQILVEVGILLDDPIDVIFDNHEILSRC